MFALRSFLGRRRDLSDELANVMELGGGGCSIASRGVPVLFFNQRRKLACRPGRVDVSGTNVDTVSKS